MNLQSDGLKLRHQPLPRLDILCAKGRTHHTFANARSTYAAQVMQVF